MRAAKVTLLGVALLTATCGKGGGSSGPVTAPTAPTGPSGQTQPPAVNVNSDGTVGGQRNVFLWGGNVSFNEQTGTNTVNFPQLTQNGAQVSGSINFYGPDGGGGPFAGVVSGTTLNFNFSIGNQGQGCGNTVSGSANVTTRTIEATFSGHRCNGQTYTNGRFTVSIPAEAPVRTSPLPVGGIWSNVMPAALGGGRWTFNISEAPIDANGSTVSGSVSVSGGTLALGAGTLTGPVTDTYPGPLTLARMTVTFAGACPSNLLFNVAVSGSDGSVLTGTVSGTTCNATLQSVGLNLNRQ